MKKTTKLLSLLIAVLMLAALLPQSAFASYGLPFRDVPADAWYYSAVKRAYETGITNGTSPTNFEPNATVTREMFLVMLFRAANIRLDVYEKFQEPINMDSLPIVYTFTDVPLGEWYSAAVGYAVDIGVTRGVDAMHFGLGQPITREQMATMAARFMDARPHAALKPAANPVKAFTDATQVSGWAQDAVEAMRVSCVLQGDKLQRVNPKAHATRAEAAAVVLRLVDATERVSFVPENTAWIRITSWDNPNMSNPKLSKEIKDPKAVQELIRYLDNMPIAAEYAMKGTGAIHIIDFFDANDKWITGYRFDQHAIDFGGTALVAIPPYLLPLILTA